MQVVAVQINKQIGSGSKVRLIAQATSYRLNMLFIFNTFGIDLRRKRGQQNGTQQRIRTEICIRIDGRSDSNKISSSNFACNPFGFNEIVLRIARIGRYQIGRCVKHGIRQQTLFPLNAIDCLCGNLPTQFERAFSGRIVLVESAARRIFGPLQTVFFVPAVVTGLERCLCISGNVGRATCRRGFGGGVCFAGRFAACRGSAPSARRSGGGIGNDWSRSGCGAVDRPFIGKQVPVCIPRETLAPEIFQGVGLSRIVGVVTAIANVLCRATLFADGVHTFMVNTAIVQVGHCNREIVGVLVGKNISGGGGQPIEGVVGVVCFVRASKIAERIGIVLDLSDIPCEIVGIDNILEYGIAKTLPFKTAQTLHHIVAIIGDDTVSVVL